MKLSFVVTTHGAMNTSSSSVEYAVMYASAWIFVSAPIVVSFSTSEPEPMTTSSPTTPLRTRAASPTITRSPSRAREHDRAGGDDRAGADPSGRVARGWRSSAARATAACRRRRGRGSARLAKHGALVDDGGVAISTPENARRFRGLSRRHAGERALGCSSVRTTAIPSRATCCRSPSPHEREEVLALEPKRLVVRDLGAVDVARPRLPLAVRLRGLPRPFS